MIVANQLRLAQAIAGEQHPPDLIVDAAIVNPAKTTQRPKPSKRAK